MQEHDVAFLPVHLPSHRSGFGRYVRPAALQLRESIEPDRLVGTAGDDLHRPARRQVEVEHQERAGAAQGHRTGDPGSL